MKDPYCPHCGVVDDIHSALYCRRLQEKEKMLKLALEIISKYQDALERLRDCDWVITPHDRMDAVRAIAREALL
jgi:dTDP-4-amino-4,6-dideoxygalactose transaminase